MNITDTLVAGTHGPLSATTRARAIVALSSVDWAACGIAGFADGTFDRWASGQAGDGESRTFGDGKMTAANAALVNGTLSHALDYDDTHFGHIGHPSVVVLPAVLAARPIDWAAFQDAALVGIEASIRVGMWLGRDHYQRGFHQTATAGAFGAALGAARAMNLTPDQTRHALGLCASMASGLKAQFGTMGKPLNAGLAARAGYEAAKWAQDGMTGANNGLEAFGAALGADCNKVALDGWGTKWHIESLSHKFHACCHGLHATLEALAQITPAPTFERINIQTHPRWMSVCNQPDPDTGLAAKFSYKQVAAMAMHGISTADIAMFRDNVAQDPALVAARKKVEVVESPDLTEMQARVTVKAAGQSVEVFHDLAEPLPIEVLEERLRGKSDVLIGVDRSAALWQARRDQDLASYLDAAYK